MLLDTLYYNKYKDEWTLVDWLDNHKGGEMDTKEVIDLQMLQ